MFGYTQQVSVKPNFFTTYLQYECDRNSPSRKKEWFALPEENKSHGIMSYKANKRVRLAIDWLIYLTKEKKSPKTKVAGEFPFKLNFVTLTLSSKQKHSDNEIKKQLLNQFLTEIRTKYNCLHYMWRAESQRNGNIHFHVVTDVFIPWRSLRTDWNRIQEKLGYVSRFTEKTGKVDPNSTDVHAIKHVKNLSAYLAKYCSKNSKGYVVMASKATAVPFKPESWLTYKHPKLDAKPFFYRQIHGKLWGLSQTLSKLKAGKKEVSGLIEQEINWLKEKFKSKVKYLANATVYGFSQAELAKVNCLALCGLLKQHYKDVTEPKPPPEITKIKPIEVVKNIVETFFYQKALF